MAYWISAASKSLAAQNFHPKKIIAKIMNWWHGILKKKLGWILQNRWVCRVAVALLLTAEILPSIIAFFAKDSSKYAILLFPVAIIFIANQTQYWEWKPLHVATKQKAESVALQQVPWQCFFHLRCHSLPINQTTTLISFQIVCNPHSNTWRRGVYVLVYGDY